jgi:rhamnosyltransferase
MLQQRSDTNFKVAGVVILYNPVISVVEKNIYSYISQVDRLYIVDNSDSSLAGFLSKTITENSHVVYFYNDGNQGIANALNCGIRFAQKDKIEWLLLMDQDSSMPIGFIETMKLFVKQTNNRNIGIIAPQIKWGKNVKSNPASLVPYSEKLVVITSGSLLRLSIVDSIGLFEEILFIDGVDIDYCLRVNIKGYKIVQLSSIQLLHQLGECSELRIFNHHIAYIGHHNSIRKYYGTRNMLYIADKYKAYFPAYCRQIKRTMLYNLIKIIFFENDKLTKMKAIYLGYIDYRNRIFGKISDDKIKHCEQ